MFLGSIVQFLTNLTSDTRYAGEREILLTDWNIYTILTITKRLHAVARLTVLASTSFGFSPIPQHGSSLAMASRNLGWETAYTRGLRQLASLAENGVVSRGLI